MRVLRIINTTATAWGLPASRAHSHAVPRVLSSLGAECQAGQGTGQGDAQGHRVVGRGTEPGGCAGGGGPLSQWQRREAGGAAT